MSTPRRGSRQDWTPAQVGRGVGSVVALAVLLAAGALGAYGYGLHGLPAPVTDLIRPLVTPTAARGWLWTVLAGLVVAALAAGVFRASLFFRRSLITMSILIGALEVGLVVYAAAGVGAATFGPHLSQVGAGRLALIVLAEVAIAGGLLAFRRDRQRRSQFATGLAEAFGKQLRREFNPRACISREWRAGRPQRVRFKLPAGFPTTSATAMATLTAALGDRMGGPVEHTLRGQVIGFTRIKVSATDAARERETERVAKIGARSFGGDISIVKVRQWGGVDGHTPVSFTARYPSAAAVTDDAFRRRIETNVGDRIGVRVKAEFQLTRDLVSFEPRPPLATFVRHPGPSVFAGKTWDEDPHGDWATLPYGIDEDGDVTAWDTRQQSHCLGNGATNSGKTVAGRCFIVAALLKGWEVGMADPKQIELVGFGHGWGARSIAATPADMADFIARVRALMDERYAEIKAKIDARIDPKVEETYRPFLVVIDEFAELVEVLGKVDEVWSMLRLARACNIHLLLMTQRPDASVFKSGSRDNLTYRYSMNGLSEQGAKMMWENTDWGRFLPPIKGRGMAGVYGTEPTEVQVFWCPDPAFPQTFEDIAARDELRAACRQIQAGVTASIAGADYDIPALSPAPEGDLDQIVTDPGELLTVLLEGHAVEAATVLAETLTAGDRIVVTDRGWDVINVHQTGGGQISVDIDALDGTHSQTVTWPIEAHVLSVATTERANTPIDPDDDPDDDNRPDKGAVLLRALDGLRANAANPVGTNATNATNATNTAGTTRMDGTAAMVGRGRMRYEEPPPVFESEVDDGLFHPPPEDEILRRQKPPARPGPVNIERPADPEPDVDTTQDASVVLTPATLPVPPVPTSSASSASSVMPSGRRADSIAPGESVRWRTKKGALTSYTVEQVETLGTVTRLVLKPARGQSKVIEVAQDEPIEVDQAATA